MCRPEASTSSASVRSVEKACTKCGEVKPLEAFDCRRGVRDGRSSHCKSCVKAYRKANKEHLREYAAAYRERNREKQRLAAKRWRKNNPGKNAEYQRMFAEENPEIIRERNRQHYLRREREKFLTKKYGISIEVYNEMLEEQGGVCAICQSPESATTRGTVRALCVDHDHATGAVRALLCNSCNSALGQAGDDPERLRAMAEYIELYANQVESSHA